MDTSNQYQPLSDLSEEDEANIIQKSQAQKESKIPPIVVNNLNYNQIKEIFKTNQISKYNIKNCSIGFKLFLNTKEDHVNLKKILENKNVEFFTYNFAEERPIKMIIKGLPKDMPLDEIYDGLNEQGFSKDKILKIHVINTNYGGSHLIHFKRNITTLNEIKQIHYINNVIVKLTPHNRTGSRPTQCRRCLMYGHGTQFCNRKNKCSICGGQHDTTECNKEKPEKPKCVNCGEEHLPQSTDCKKYKEFVLIRENIKINKQINQMTMKRVDYEYKERGFPALHPPRKTILHHEFNQKFSSKSTNETTNRSADLFSLSDITNLVNDIITNLSCCTTKQEQFAVITKLSIKYLYTQT